MGQERRPLNTAPRKRFLHDRPCNELSRSGGNRGLDEGQTVRSDFLANGPHGGLKRAHLDLSRPHVPEILLQVVTLNVDHYAVGQLQAVAVVRSDQRLFFEDAAPDHKINFGILGFYGRDAAVEHGDLPVAPRAGTLAPDHELQGPPLLVASVGENGGHDGADKADAHDDDDLFALRTSLGR